jgi:carbon storage regulator
MLVLTRKLQEKIRIGDNVTITVLRVKGQAVRIGIEAPRELRVVRGELPPQGEQSASELTVESSNDDPSPHAGRSAARNETQVPETSDGDDAPAGVTLRRLPQRRLVNRYGAPPLRLACSHALAGSE